MNFIRTIRTIVLVVVMGVIAGCASDREVIDNASQMHSQLAPAVMNDPELSNYLQQVGARIVAAGQVVDSEGRGPKKHRDEDTSWMYSGNMRFHLVNSKTLNAFTTGGEHMYIYNELLQKCRTEDELAAVMAHEYAHVYCRHIHKGMDRQKLVLGAALAAGAAGYAAGDKDNRLETAGASAGVAMLVGQFVGMSYTREDEAEADQYGFSFYIRCGWDPRHFGDFFQQMIDLGFDTTPELASDHPTLRSRVEIAHKRAMDIGNRFDSFRKPPIADRQRFAALKQRAALLGRSLPNDKSMEEAQNLLASFSSCVSPVEQPGQQQAKQKELTKIQKQENTATPAQKQAAQRKVQKQKQQAP